LTDRTENLRQSVQICGSHLREITHGFGNQIALDGVYAPALDVTPGDLTAGFITERGSVHPYSLSIEVSDPQIHTDLRR
jgi:methylthioribose-1-phosphate isomerase